MTKERENSEIDQEIPKWIQDIGNNSLSAFRGNLKRHTMNLEDVPQKQHQLFQSTFFHSQDDIENPSIA